MIPRKFKVRQAFLDECAEKNCCDTLDMYEQEKSRGEVIEWKRRHWVCTGSVSRGSENLSVWIRLCVPEVDYRGAPYGYDGETPALYYPGGRFRWKGQGWILTDVEIELFPFTKQKRR